MKYYECVDISTFKFYLDQSATGYAKIYSTSARRSKLHRRKYTSSISDPETEFIILSSNTTVDKLIIGEVEACFEIFI